MTFQPAIVGTGLVGWQFLKSTKAQQQQVFEASPRITRATENFMSRIGSVRTAEDLVEDRQLMRVALGAFGLQDDIDNRFFIQKVLEEGVGRPDALANKLSDDRYKSLARAFDFDSPAGPRTAETAAAANIVDRYLSQRFEVAVGEQNDDLRLALNFERALPEISVSSTSADAKWFRIMGTPPLRNVLETALGLPASFGQLDIDKQLEVFRDKMRARFDILEVDQMNDPAILEKIVQAFFLQSEIASMQQTSSGQVALNLLQEVPLRRSTYTNGIIF